MSRYELSEGSSNKFWEIAVEGSSVVTRYGRIGTKGRKTLRETASAAAAGSSRSSWSAEQTGALRAAEQVEGSVRQGYGRRGRSGG